MARAAANGRKVVAESPDDPYAALPKHACRSGYRDEPGEEG